MAAVSTAVVDSGPTDSCRDDPSTAYTQTAATNAQSPEVGWMPASCAYAMTCGIAYAATVIPASTSPRSQDRSYARSTPRRAPSGPAATGSRRPRVRPTAPG